MRNLNPPVALAVFLALSPAMASGVVYFGWGNEPCSTYTRALAGMYENDEDRATVAGIEAWVAGYVSALNEDHATIDLPTLDTWDGVAEKVAANCGYFPDTKIHDIAYEAYIGQIF